MNIAVYCGSVYGNDPKHADIARRIGEWIGKNGHTLVYGGSDTGLMGEVANAVMACGGRAIGVLPDVRLIHENKHPAISEYYYTQTMSERKDKMIELSDAYIALPGGFGTLDEFSDVLCLNRLQVIRKPVVLVNANGFYEPIRKFMLKVIDCGFVGADEMDMVLFSEDVEEIEEFVSRGV